MPRKKLTTEEKDQRKLERKAAALTAASLRDVGGAGSLFAAEAQTFTRDDAFWHTRRTVANMIEHLHAGPASRLTKAFNAVQLQAIERFARTIITAAEVDEIAARLARRFETSLDYRVNAWCQILTRGERVTRLHVEERPEWVHPTYNREGRRVLEVDPLPSGDWVAFMTYEAFRAQFPPLWGNVAEEPEPAGQAELFDAVMARIRGC